MDKLLKLAILLLFLSFASVSSAQEQAGMKILTITDDPVIEAPLQIEVYLESKKIKSDVPFIAPDDWIEKLRIFVTNRTNDEIKFASFALDFPTEHDGEVMMKRFFIDYGRAEVLTRNDQNTDAEERRIGGKASALVTIDSNDPLGAEVFKHARESYSAKLNAKLFDKGILSLYSVEFQSRVWDRGVDFDKKADGSWEKNKEKEQKLHERIRKATQSEREPQIGFFKRSFTGKSSQTLCYTVPPPPRTGSTRSCSPAAGCSAPTCTYFRPSLEVVDVGRKKILTSPACSGAGCGSCCEPNVPDLGAICRSE